MIAYVITSFIVGVASGLVANYVYERFLRRDNR